MRKQVAIVLLGLFVLPSISLAQRASDSESDCLKKAIFETERNSCEIAHLYTTQNFLATCKATQQRLFHWSIPKKSGCNLNSRPDVVILETSAKNSIELKSFVNAKNVSGFISATHFQNSMERKSFVNTKNVPEFLSATRFQITNAMRDTDPMTGENRADPFDLWIVSRLDKNPNNVRPPDDLLSPNDFPDWLRPVAQKLYSAALPNYTASRKAQIESENIRFESQLPQLASLTHSRIKVTLNDPSILRDAKMPNTMAKNNSKYAKEIKRDEKIAEIEADLADKARSEGRVYRALWFWSQFREPLVMRTIFNGNRVPEPGFKGSVYFYSGYPLKRGTGVQTSILTAWVRTYEAHCGDLLPENPDTLRTESHETTGPYFRRITRVTGSEVLRFQPGLMRPYIASRDAANSKLAGQIRENLWEMISEVGRGGVGASGVTTAFVEPYIHALDDFDRFFKLVGCNSPTARQMNQGIFLVANDAALPSEATTAGISGAEWVSDKPQGVGEYRLHSEVCWEYDTSHNPCGCFIDLAAQKMNKPTPMPVSIPYLEVHKAFMSASDIEQRVCRSPLTTIGRHSLTAR